jgi:DNA-binding SARP family transcriptional activator/pimeloyl-ACP methyl ester carboxylesterase
MHTLDVELLGRFVVRVDGGDIPQTAWAHRRSGDLVKLLALAPRARLQREQAMDALWPDLDPGAAAANLHKAAHHARRALGAVDAVVLSGGSIQLGAGTVVATDVERFELEARAALASGEPGRCRDASILYRGDLLPDDLYADWTHERRERLRRLYLDLLRTAQLWEEVLAAEPLDEQAHRELMRAYANDGNRVAALFQFGHLRELLRRELGMEPDPGTVALYRDLALGPPETPAVVPPPIQYARSGDISVAYQVVGDGVADLLMIPGWVSHLGLDWEEPLWVRWCERITRFARLIRFDKRGTGLSDRPPGVATLEERMEDARAVLEASGVERAHVMGWSEGGPLAILLAVTHPELVASLVLYGTQACFCPADDYPWSRTQAEVDDSIIYVREQWGTESFAQHFAPRGDRRFAAQFAAYLRAGASPAAGAALEEANMKIDVRPLLARVRAPSLVLARTGDPVGPPAAARYMAERMVDAHFIELPGDDHVIWVGDIESLCAAIEQFIVEVGARPVGAHA